MVLLVAVAAACARDSDHQREQVRQQDCVTCHLPDYQATTNPPHVDRFPTACAQCHTTDAWVPASFEHPWPLDGAHATALCLACHTGDPPRFAGTPTACVGCHRADYDASPYPGHTSFPTTCQDCHSTSAWRPAVALDHPWPLDGAHATAPCASCHTGDPPRYAGTPTQCVGCHRADYDRSPYPGHATFPTTCADCHTTSAWRPAMGGAHPEGAFPIANGAHAGIACLDCHDPSLGAPQRGMNTDCVGCHTGQHARSLLDSKHVEVPGYPAGAAAPNFCLECHPNGRN